MLFHEKPSPDFQELIRILMKEEKPKRVPNVEIIIDAEVIEYILRKYMGEEIPRFWKIREKKSNAIWEHNEIILLEDEREKAYLKAFINFWYQMGYDYVPAPLLNTVLRDIPVPPGSARKTKDTAQLSRGERTWVEEGRGVITTWEDFDKFPWDEIEMKNLDGFFDFFHTNLPEGMKIVIEGDLFETVVEKICGYVGLSHLLYEKPELAEAIFDRWGQILYNYYQKTVPRDSVGILWHADDLGYKAGTLIKPSMLRKYVFPWFRKYAALAHKHNKPYFYHCCGNVEEVMEDLIEDVKIDAFHSFQDEIKPVTEFKEQYGNQIAVLGGVDVDKLTRLSEDDLRTYVRKILSKCMPGGGYALGSGNSIANYIPVDNYFIMLEEGLKWL